MSRILVAGVLVAIGACDDEACPTFEAAVEAQIDNVPVMDCGDMPAVRFPDSYEPAEFHAAKDCVLAANAMQRPFVVRWHDLGIDIHRRLAMIGREEAGVYGVSLISGSFDASETIVADFRLSCGRLDVIAECNMTDLVTRLCILCRDEEVVETCD